MYRSGQKRGVIGKIRKELKRRSAIEPIIGRAKADHKMDSCRLKVKQYNSFILTTNARLFD